MENSLISKNLQADKIKRQTLIEITINGKLKPIKLFVEFSFYLNDILC